MTTDCQHEILYFADGSFHLTCGHCGYSWAAVGHGPNEQLDYAALVKVHARGDERGAYFYQKSVLHANRLNDALAMLVVQVSPEDPHRLQINLTEATAFLYGNPQWEILKGFEEKVLPFYIGRQDTKMIRESLLNEARNFLKNAAMTHIPR
jgi:hypothetical protein